MTLTFLGSVEHVKHNSTKWRRSVISKLSTVSSLYFIYCYPRNTTYFNEQTTVLSSCLTSPFASSNEKQHTYLIMKQLTKQMRHQTLMHVSSCSLTVFVQCNVSTIHTLTTGWELSTSVVLEPTRSYLAARTVRTKVSPDSMTGNNNHLVARSYHPHMYDLWSRLPGRFIVTARPLQGELSARSTPIV